MEVIILAGWLGTRLADIAKDVPKPMVPVAGDTPFLQHLLDLILKTGKISKIILSVWHKWEVINDYFGDEYKWIPLVYAVEDSPLWTGWAIKMAMTFVSWDDFLVVNGDTYFAIDLDHFFQKHIQAHAPVSMALKPMTNFDRYGNVLLQWDNIIQFQEKQFTSEGNINAWIYAIKKQYLESMSLPGKFSLERDVFTENCFKDHYQWIVYDDYFIDIGIPEDYVRANTDLLNLI